MRSCILSASRAFVTVKAGGPIWFLAFFPLPALALAPSTPWIREQKLDSTSGVLLAARIWEGGEDVSAPAHGAVDFSEPPSGPPIWERGPDEALRFSATDKAAPKSAEDSLLASKANPPKPVENLVNSEGKLQLPSVDRIASELGYKPQELKRYVNDFATALSAGQHSAAFRRICARDEESCHLLADFQAQTANAKRERRRSRRRVRHFRIGDGNIAQAQRFDFQILTNNLKVENEARFFALAEKSLGETDCPRNLSAALSVKAEEYFPNQKARSMARNLFDHARGCLSVDEEAFERLYIRNGLFALYDGNKARARELLKEALRATVSSERYRALYWMGKIAFEAEDSATKGKENEYWTDLLNQYPLSFYAIEVATTLGRDPLEVITQRKVGGMRRESPSDPELNRMICWLEALYSFKHSSAVGKWASWIVRSSEDDLDVDVLHYISSMKIASGLYRSNIQMLFSYFKKNPAALNDEGLKLLYPRPYFDLIQDASRGKIDSFLVMGLVRQESGFDARAVSHARAKGLMQIIPQTARRLASGGHRKLLNEKENAKMGVKYLLQLAADFENNVELVLAAYNAGPHRVFEWQRRNPERKQNPQLWNDLIPYMETRDYVVSILRNNYLYLRLYGGREPASAGLFASDTVKSLIARVPNKR